MGVPEKHTMRQTLAHSLSHTHTHTHTHIHTHTYTHRYPGYGKIFVRLRNFWTLEVWSVIFPRTHTHTHSRSLTNVEPVDPSTLQFSTLVEVRVRIVSWLVGWLVHTFSQEPL